MNDHYKKINDQVNELLRVGLEASQDTKNKELAVRILRITSLVAHNYMIATGLDKELKSFWQDKKSLSL